MRKLALLAAAVLVTGCSGGENAADAAREHADAATEAAQGAMKDASAKMGSMAGDVAEAGALKLAEMKNELSEKAVEVLTSIQDVPSAQKALPDLQDLAANATAIKDRLADIGASAGAVPEGTRNAIQTQVDRIKSIPQVAEIVSKPLDTLMSFFGG